MGGVKMNENLNLVEILKGCPSGVKLYSPLYGDITFDNIYLNLKYPIRTKEACFTSDGRYISDFNGECMLFPAKDQRDWAKFERFWDKPKVDKFDVNTLQPFDKVLTRCDDSEKWGIDLFGYFDNLYKGVCCLDAYLQMCIPYNDETKHLVGTNKEAPEYYRYWEE